MLETWGDGHAPPYSVQATALKPGTPDHSSRTWGEYGGRVGVWRILRTLDTFGVKATFCPNAKSAELYPEAIRQMVKSGHGLAAHGVTQDRLLAYMEREEQRATIQLSLKSFEMIAGQRPDGWVSPVLAWTPDTLDLLIEEKLLWYGDPNYIDLPQRLDTGTGSIIGIPTSEFSDHRVLRASPRDFYDVYRETFDYLYQHEPMSFLHMALHCHWGGRPVITAVVRKLLEYFLGFEHVWFAKHSEIAEWVNSQPSAHSYPTRFARNQRR
jgi:peptidoglycan/xylan/chitin deacetylase (PgdA/CDA1 family)